MIEKLKRNLKENKLLKEIKFILTHIAAMSLSAGQRATGFGYSQVFYLP